MFVWQGFRRCSLGFLMRTLHTVSDGLVCAKVCFESDGTMKKRKVQFGIFVGVIAYVGLMVAACEESPKYQDNTTSSLSAEDFKADFSQAYCDFLVECQEALPNRFSRTLGVLLENGGACQLDRFTQQIDRLFRRVERGQVRYDPVEAARCLQAIRSCDNASLESDSCAKVFQGMVQEGQPCLDTQDCAPAFYCDFDPTGDRCRQTCLARKSLGEPCSFGGECRGNAEFAQGACAPENPASITPEADSVCLGVVLRTDVAQGEACGDLIEAGNRVSATCGSGLVCDVDLDQTSFVESRGVCRPPSGVGEPCNGFVCERGTICEEQVCVAFSIQNNVGDSCIPPDSLDELRRETCNDLLGLTCIAGRCEQLGDGSQGSRCVFGSIANACAEGFFCKIDVSSPERLGTCEAQSALGEPCTASFDDSCLGDEVSCTFLDGDQGICEMPGEDACE